MLGSQTVGDLPLPVVYMQWYASMSQNESVQRLLERHVLLHRMSKEVSFDRYVYTTRSFLIIVAEIGAKVIKKNVAVIARPKAVFFFEKLGLWPTKPAGLHLVGEDLGAGLLGLGLVDVLHQDTLVLEDVTLGLLPLRSRWS